MILADCVPPPKVYSLSVSTLDFNSAALRMARLYYDRYQASHIDLLDWSNVQGRTALHLAAVKGKEDLVCVRLKRPLSDKPCLTRLFRCYVILTRISTYPTIRGTHRCTSESGLLYVHSSWIDGCLKCKRLGTRLSESIYLENILYDTYIIHGVDCPTPHWARL